MLRLLLLAHLAAAQHADVRYQGPLFSGAAESKYIWGELGAHSLLQDGRVLWIYDSRRLETSESPDAAVIEAGVDIASATTILTEPGTVFYPTSALKVGNSNYLFYAYAESSAYKGEGLAIGLGSSFARYSHDGGYAFWGADQPNFGLASVVGKDGLLYLYGAAHGKPGELKLARAKPEAVAEPEQYEFFAGEGWTKDWKLAADLFKGSPAEGSVSYNEYLGAYLMLYGRYPQNDVVIRTAPEPWGPWSAPVPIHRCVLSDSKGSCAAVREQPALAKDGGKKIYFTVNDPFRFYAGGRPELYAALLDKTRPAQKPDSLQISVNYNYPATLFRLISALANHSEPWYEDFWRKNFGFGDAEKELLKDYARIQEAYDRSIDSGETESASPLRRTGFSLREKWPPIFAESESLEEAWGKAEALLDSKDIVGLKRVFAHFDARLRPYWEKHSDGLYHAATDFDQRRWRLKIADFLGRVARFYGLGSGLERRYTLSLIWHPPTAAAKESNSERIGRVMLVELPEDLGLEDQLDVVVHEFIHELYFSREPELESDLDAELLGRDARTGLFAVGGMNEGLATALGQGLFVKEYLPERFSLKSAWYESGVDAYAKAVYPAVHAAFERGRPLGAFNEDWLSALAPSAKEARLPAFFTNLQLLADAKTADLSRPVWEALSAGSAFAYTLGDKQDEERFALKLKAHWAEPIVVLLEPASLDERVSGWMDWDIDAGMIKLLKARAAKAPLVTVAHSKRGRPYLLLLGAADALKAKIPALKDMRP